MGEKYSRRGALDKGEYVREGNASGVCCSVRIISTVPPLNARSSSKRRHDGNRYGSHMVSRIAKLLFCLSGYSARFG